MKKNYMLFIIWGALFGGFGIGVTLSSMIPSLVDEGFRLVFTLLTLFASFALAYGVRIFKENQEKENKEKENKEK